jgi:hypothetical protein
MIVRLLLIATAFTTVAAYAQQPNNGLRQDQIYELLFREIAHYQRSATTTSTSSAQHFAGFHARTFQLDSKHAASLNATALKCINLINTLDSEAAAIVKTAKLKYRNAPRGTVVPRLPAALTALQKQKQIVIASAVDELDSAFGQARFALFDRQVRQYVASNLNRPPRMIEVR